MKDEETMATLITSPWSTGRRFTLVKPAFKGLEQAKLTASDGADSDLFGYSVAVSGDGNTAVIGALLMMMTEVVIAAQPTSLSALEAAGHSKQS
jgi:hypothetical protein